VIVIPNWLGGWLEFKVSTNTAIPIRDGYTQLHYAIIMTDIRDTVLELKGRTDKWQLDRL